MRLTEIYFKNFVCIQSLNKVIGINNVLTIIQFTHSWRFPEQLQFLYDFPFVSLFVRPELMTPKHIYICYNFPQHDLFYLSRFTFVSKWSYHSFTNLYKIYIYQILLEKYMEQRNAFTYVFLQKGIYKTKSPISKTSV